MYESPARLRGWPEHGQGSVRMLRSVRPAGVGALRRTGLGSRLLRPGADVRLFQHDSPHVPTQQNLIFLSPNALSLTADF